MPMDASLLDVPAEPKAIEKIVCRRCFALLEVEDNYCRRCGTPTPRVQAAWAQQAGLMTADLAEKGCTDLPIEMFRLGRFETNVN